MNVTLLGRLVQDETGALPKRAEALLERMLRASQRREVHSGGAALQVRGADGPRQILSHCLNPERGDLARRLTRRVVQAAKSRRGFDQTFLVQAHLRFRTAGAVSEHEAQSFHSLDASQPGSRRILATSEGRRAASVRCVETAITHHGDLQALRWRGVRLDYGSLPGFFERVLGHDQRWLGGSPRLAGAVELFLTQGMWLESLRLAYQLRLAPPPPDPSVLARAPALGWRRSFGTHPAPSRGVLETWAALAERVWGGCWHKPTSFAAACRFRRRLAESLARELGPHGFSNVTSDRLTGFCETAVDAFLNNDLYRAVRQLEPLLEGTFGCVVTSTLEPGCAVVLARGQPVSLGWTSRSGLVGVASERAALRVTDAAGAAAFDQRLDLDFALGEVAKIQLGSGAAPSLTIYDITHRRERGFAELTSSGRIIPLRNNAYVCKLLPEEIDPTRRDIDDVVPTLNLVRTSWHSAGSTNLLTAHAFAQALFAADEPHLLVVGVTNDLWIAEQFVQNLKLLLPRLCAEAMSSNAVLRDAARLPLERASVVLCVSQSGQDFPTLGALLVLNERLRRFGNSALFVLSSELDTLMGQVIGQRYTVDAPFGCRIFCNHTGFRRSEAATLGVNATHHTLVELALFLAERAHAVEPRAVALAPSELAALRLRRDRTVEHNAREIVVAFGAGGKLAEQVGARVCWRRWGWHVLEGFLIFSVAVVVLELNLQFGLGLEPSRLIELLGGEQTQANVLVHACLVPLVVWGTRWVQRRPLLQRQAGSDLLIGDTRYVHKVAWFLARKLFRSSRGFISIEQCSLNGQDDLAPTHEPLHGTLALLGIPDARRLHLRERAAAARIAARQLVSSRSWGGAGAEVLVVGRGSREREVRQVYLCAPGPLAESSPALDALVEDMFDSWERMLVMQLFLTGISHRIARFPVIGREQLHHFGAEARRFQIHSAAPDLEPGEDVGEVV